MILLNPKKHDREYPDQRSREIMLKTIEFFENKGRGKIKKDDHERTWYADFLEFQKDQGLFATLLTPTPYGGQDARWDTWRNCEFNEILSFYGLAYWYTWQVSILGLGPIWISDNETVKRKTAQLLEEGGIFAFGLSEKEHGADLYSTEMALTPLGDGKYTANGRKYYIGNANEAALVSTFGKMSDSGDYVFFVVGSKHGKYECVQNVVSSQNFVAEYALHDYPITEEDILARGRDAWDAALNTVNIGKFNLGWASIGMCTHAFYEAIDHAANRVLYGRHVSDFPHIKQLLTDAYTRLVAMKLFALRAADYMRCASPDDRRYLLYNPMVKMKVTTQGEEVINLLWDVIAAKGFEKDTFFEMAARDIRSLPKLEGTVHVNMALIIKFMPNYFFNPDEFSIIPRMDEPVNDDFLFAQGPTKGLGNIRFHDYNLAYRSRPAQHRDLLKAGGIPQGASPAGPARRGATQGHRFSADVGGALHPGGLRAVDYREQVHLRGRGRSGRSDIRLHGEGFLQIRPSTLFQDLEYREADGVVPADDRKAGGGYRPLRACIYRQCLCHERSVSHE
jgi:acyl-CoA dehydrogenase